MFAGGVGVWVGSTPYSLLQSFARNKPFCFFSHSSMERHALKNVNNSLNTNIYSYLETSGGQSSNPYLNVVHFLNTRAD
jgi:hypothetical protein